MLRLTGVRDSHSGRVRLPAPSRPVAGIRTLLARHGWPKLMLRPPSDRDVEAQNALKKAFSDAVRESSAGCCGPRSSFTDHVRRRSAVSIGPVLGHAGPRQGVRPKVVSQLIREFLPLWSGQPKNGACCYLIKPAADTVCFLIFLDALAKRLPGSTSCCLVEIRRLP
jgi:hypothetical protein